MLDPHHDATQELQQENAALKERLESGCPVGIAPELVDQGFSCSAFWPRARVSFNASHDGCQMHALMRALCAS